LQASWDVETQLLSINLHPSKDWNTINSTNFQVGETDTSNRLSTWMAKTLAHRFSGGLVYWLMGGSWDIFHQLEAHFR